MKNTDAKEKLKDVTVEDLLKVAGGDPEFGDPSGTVESGDEMSSGGKPFKFEPFKV